MAEVDGLADVDDPDDVDGLADVDGVDDIDGAVAPEEAPALLAPVAPAPPAAAGCAMDFFSAVRCFLACFFFAIGLVLSTALLPVASVVVCA
ncbi:hypothetical protein GCM10022212_26900 [Actimicrobium antarcticum]|uniref:Uncharacterized protein n=1 Tax=Actimicrobium antarcticum TaxID=1051899 RepID=A0ABP7TKA8_9BURK